MDTLTLSPTENKENGSGCEEAVAPLLEKLPVEHNILVMPRLFPAPVKLIEVRTPNPVLNAVVKEESIIIIISKVNMSERWLVLANWRMHNQAMYSFEMKGSLDSVTTCSKVFCISTLGMAVIYRTTTYVRM